MGKDVKIRIPHKKVGGKDFIKKLLEKRQENKKKQTKREG